MYNKKVLSDAMKNLNKVKVRVKKKAPIVDPMGQWNHPGEVTRIPGRHITMGPDPRTGEPLKQPLLGISDKGEKQMMFPGGEYVFEEGTKYVDELPKFPEAAKRGGSLKKFLPKAQVGFGALGKAGNTLSKNLNILDDLYSGYQGRPFGGYNFKPTYQIDKMTRRLLSEPYLDLSQGLTYDRAGDLSNYLGDFSFRFPSEGYDATQKMLQMASDPQWQPSQQDFFTNDEMANLIRQEKSWIEAKKKFDQMDLSAYKEPYILPGTDYQIMKVPEGLFESMFPNVSRANFRSKLVTPGQENTLWNFLHPTGSNLEPDPYAFTNTTITPGLLGDWNKSRLSMMSGVRGNDELLREASSLKIHEGNLEALATLPDEEFLSEFGTWVVARLAPDDLKGLSTAERKEKMLNNATPEQISEWRAQLSQMVWDDYVREANYYEKQLEQPFTGSDAWKQITDQTGYKNQYGGLVKAKEGGEREFVNSREHGIDTPIYVDVEVKPSPIAGDGLFSKQSIPGGTEIGVSHVRKTFNKNDQQYMAPFPSKILGMYNHDEKSPNVTEVDNGDHIVLIALRDIQPGEELVSNYNDNTIEDLEKPEDFKNELTKARYGLSLPKAQDGKHLILKAAEPVLKLATNTNPLKRFVGQNIITGGIGLGPHIAPNILKDMAIEAAHLSGGNADFDLDGYLNYIKSGYQPTENDMYVGRSFNSMLSNEDIQQLASQYFPYSVGQRDLIDLYFTGNDQFFTEQPWLSHLEGPGSLDKYTKIHGPLKSYQLQSQIPHNQPVSGFELFENLKIADPKYSAKERMQNVADLKTGDPIHTNYGLKKTFNPYSHYYDFDVWKHRQLDKAAAGDKDAVRIGFNKLFDRYGDVIPLEVGTSGTQDPEKGLYTDPIVPMDDIAGHMKYLRRISPTQFDLTTRDVWGFHPKDYTKKWFYSSPLEAKNYYDNLARHEQFAEDMRKYVANLGPRLFTRMGNPFLLTQSNPIFWDKWKNQFKKGGLINRRDGGTTPDKYVQAELSQEEIDKYVKGGYIVEELPKAQTGKHITKALSSLAKLPIPKLKPTPNILGNIKNFGNLTFGYPEIPLFQDYSDILSQTSVDGWAERMNMTQALKDMNYVGDEFDQLRMFNAAKTDDAMNALMKHAINYDLTGWRQVKPQLQVTGSKYTNAGLRQTTLSNEEIQQQREAMINAGVNLSDPKSISAYFATHIPFQRYGLREGGLETLSGYGADAIYLSARPEEYDRAYGPHMWRVRQPFDFSTGNWLDWYTQHYINKNPIRFPGTSDFNPALRDSQSVFFDTGYSKGNTLDPVIGIGQGLNTRRWASGKGVKVAEPDIDPDNPFPAFYDYMNLTPEERILINAEREAVEKGFKTGWSDKYKKGGELPKANSGKIVKSLAKLYNVPALSGVKKDWSGNITKIYNPYFEEFSEPLADLSRLTKSGDFHLEQIKEWESLAKFDKEHLKNKILQINNPIQYETLANELFQERFKQIDATAEIMKKFGINSPEAKEARSVLDKLHLPIDPATMSSVPYDLLSNISDQSENLLASWMDRFNLPLDQYNLQKAIDQKRIDAYRNAPLSYKLFGLSPGWKVAGIRHPFETDVLFPHHKHNKIGKDIYDSVWKDDYEQLDNLRQFHPWSDNTGEKYIQYQNDLKKYNDLNQRLRDIIKSSSSFPEGDNPFESIKRDGGNVKDKLPKAHSGKIVKALSQVTKLPTPTPVPKLPVSYPNQFMTTSNLGKFAGSTGNINLDQLKAAIGKESMGLTHKWPMLEKQLITEFGEDIPTLLPFSEVQRLTNQAIVPYTMSLNPQGNYNYGIWNDGGVDYLQGDKKLNLGFTKAKDIYSLEGAAKNDYSNAVGALSKINFYKDDFATNQFPLKGASLEDIINETLYDFNWKHTPRGVEGNPITSIEDLEMLINNYKHEPLSQQTSVLSGLGKGSLEHNNPEGTLAAAHSYIDPDTPDTRTYTQFQSDALQGTHHIWKNKEKQIEKIKKQILDHENEKAHFLSLNEDPEAAHNIYQEPINNLNKQIVKLEEEIIAAKGSNPKQKELLEKNWESVLLQQLMTEAAAEGMTKIRIPTGETTIKVQNYHKIPQWGEDDWRDVQNIFEADNFEEAVANNLETSAQRDIKLDYTKQQKTVIRRYDKLPKLLKKTFGFTDDQIKTVTDRFGNTWFEVEIPESFLQGQGQIIHKFGGSVNIGDEVDEATMQRLIKEGYTFEEI